MSSKLLRILNQHFSQDEFTLDERRQLGRIERNIDPQLDGAILSTMDALHQRTTNQSGAEYKSTSLEIHDRTKWLVSSYTSDDIGPFASIFKYIWGDAWNTTKRFDEKDLTEWLWRGPTFIYLR